MLKQEYINQEVSFSNVVDIQLMKPNRAIMGENAAFMAAISSGSDFEKPVVLALQEDKDTKSQAAVMMLSEANYDTVLIVDDSTNSSNSSTGTDSSGNSTNSSNSSTEANSSGTSTNSSSEVPTSRRALFAGNVQNMKTSSALYIKSSHFQKRNLQNDSSSGRNL